MNTNILAPNNIIELRSKLGLSRDDLAKMLGVSSKTVARWENLKNNDPPTGTTAIVLSSIVSNALDLPLNEEKSELVTKMGKIHEDEQLKENPDTIYLLLNEATYEEKAEICNALKVPIDSDVFKISKEYRSVAGHTMGNWFRGAHDLPYKEILVDVANKLKPKGSKDVYHLGDGRSEEDVENVIVEYFAQKVAAELSKMKPEVRAEKFEQLKNVLLAGKNPELDSEAIEEIKKAFSLGSVAVASGGIASLLTGSVTASLFYSGAFAGIWAGVFGMSSSLLLLSGTGVGTLVAAPLLLIVLGSPSYKKTIPVTLQLINIRRRVTQKMLT